MPTRTEARPGIANSEVAGKRLPTPAQMGLSMGSSGRTVTLTADATPHSKGAWTEIIASTTGDTQWIGVAVYNMFVSGSDTRGLVDIGIGPNPSEVAIVSSLPSGFTNTQETTGLSYLLPVRVPPGTRIAARLQALITVDTCICSVYCFTTPGSPTINPPGLVTIGADTAASTSSAFMTTSATYAQITASTAQAFQALIAMPCGGVSGAFTADTTETMTLGVGASGAEVALGTSFQSWTSTEQVTNLASHLAGPSAIYAARHVPAASRIACKITTGRAYKGVIVLGVPYS